MKLAIRTDLFIAGNTDYVAADLMLSSDTLVTGEGGFGGVRVTGAQYNDLANGGVNQNEGDHWASISIGVNSMGELGADACLFRSQTANYESTCLVNETPESNCPRFRSPLRMTPTTAHLFHSIELTNR